MTDLDIAIAHLVLADAETVEDIAMWRDHWRLTAKHEDDCTKQPWTCSRCLADEAVRMVPVYRALFAGIGATVTTVESPPFVFDEEPDDHRPQARGGETERKAEAGPDRKVRASDGEPRTVLKTAAINPLRTKVPAGLAFLGAALRSRVAQ